ncbi:MAG TPA: hypothetical protein DCO72_03060 [Ruminococcus sp.]|nr:hypothetical protein [Ruminococcus sp.]
MKLKILTISVLCCCMFLCGCGGEETNTVSSLTPQEKLISSETVSQVQTASEEEQTNYISNSEFSTLELNTEDTEIFTSPDDSTETTRLPASSNSTQSTELPVSSENTENSESSDSPENQDDLENPAPEENQEDSENSALQENQQENQEDFENLDNANDSGYERQRPVRVEDGLLSGIKIGIDPGHQKYANTAPETVAPNSAETKYKVTGGAQGVATGIPEYVTVLDISKKLRDKLEAEGAEVYMTRETHDVDISNQERAKMMNNHGVDLMLRVHCDSSENSSKQGIALYVSESNSIASISRQYAEIILPYVTSATGANNNGIVQNDNYTGQNWAEVPCMMIECGFVSNSYEDKLLNDDAYQELLTDGILQGIIACFEP